MKTKIKKEKENGVRWLVIMHLKHGVSGFLLLQLCELSVNKTFVPQNFSTKL